MDWEWQALREERENVLDALKEREAHPYTLHEGRPEPLYSCDSCGDSMPAESPDGLCDACRAAVGDYVVQSIVDGATWYYGTMAWVLDPALAARFETHEDAVEAIATLQERAYGLAAPYAAAAVVAYCGEPVDDEDCCCK